MLLGFRFFIRAAFFPIVLLLSCQQVNACERLYEVQALGGDANKFNKNKILLTGGKHSPLVREHVKFIQELLSSASKLIERKQANEAVYKLSKTYNLVNHLAVGDYLNPCLQPSILEQIATLSKKRVPIGDSYGNLFYYGINKTRPFKFEVRQLVVLLFWL